MPHKRNPVTSRADLRSGARGAVQRSGCLENIALWHERDISHSSVERVILPDSCILTDYLIAKTAWLVRDMRVNPNFMRRNLDLTKGLVFSGQLLFDLAASGMLREHAYKVVQSHAMRAWDEELDFRALVEQDSAIAALLSAEQLARSFSLDRQLKNVDAIFARVF